MDCGTYDSSVDHWTVGQPACQSVITAIIKILGVASFLFLCPLHMDYGVVVGVY